MTLHVRLSSWRMKLLPNIKSSFIQELCIIWSTTQSSNVFEKFVSPFTRERLLCFSSLGLFSLLFVLFTSLRIQLLGICNINCSYS
ncbi:hypothetical protein L6452_36651 [Arctium lappa]|uniref:Uncharacterized protein n=1 Tax=Arctium lappa TaxID=4217 RepID=A0ACB8YAG0_ARCLA|nr:hypothetical protein L6452_36651 [Arctium lappa]